MRRILDARWTNWRTIAGIWAVAKLPGAPEESARFDAPTRGWLWHDRPEEPAAAWRASGGAGRAPGLREGRLPGLSHRG